MLSPAQGEIEIEAGRRVFAPGDEVTGTVHWRLDEAPESVSLRLFWQTQGRGDSDVDVVEEKVVETPGADDRRPFRFRLPEGPYTFSGQLISLLWGLELVAEPAGALAHVEITVSPTGGEVVLRESTAQGE